MEMRSVFKWLGTKNISTFSGFIAIVIPAFFGFVTGGMDDPRLEGITSPAGYRLAHIYLSRFSRNGHKWARTLAYV